MADVAATSKPTPSITSSNSGTSKRSTIPTGADISRLLGVDTILITDKCQQNYHPPHVVTGSERIVKKPDHSIPTAEHESGPGPGGESKAVQRARTRALQTPGTQPVKLISQTPKPSLVFQRKETRNKKYEGTMQYHTDVSDDTAARQVNADREMVIANSQLFQEHQQKLKDEYIAKTGRIPQQNNFPNAWPQSNRDGDEMSESQQ